jgi:hypothetical protein
LGAPCERLSGGVGSAANGRHAMGKYQLQP